MGAFWHYPARFNLRENRLVCGKVGPGNRRFWTTAVIVHKDRKSYLRNCFGRCLKSLTIFRAWQTRTESSGKVKISNGNNQVAVINLSLKSNLNLRFSHLARLKSDSHPEAGRLIRTRKFQETWLGLQFVLGNWYYYGLLKRARVCAWVRFWIKQSKPEVENQLELNLGFTGTAQTNLMLTVI